MKMQFRGREQEREKNFTIHHYMLSYTKNITFSGDLTIHIVEKWNCCWRLRNSYMWIFPIRPWKYNGAYGKINNHKLFVFLQPRISCKLTMLNYGFLKYFENSMGIIPQLHIFNYMYYIYVQRATCWSNYTFLTNFFSKPLPFKRDYVDRVDIFANHALTTIKIRFMANS